MLTGFNTDISYEGVVYHVQTEDKGPENPMLLSLVYVRGEILAAKRTYYAKDIEAGVSMDEIQKKLEKQHKAILALINRGRVNELIEMRDRQSAATHSALPVLPETPPPPPPPLPPPPPAFAARPAGVTEFLSPLLLDSIQQANEPPASVAPPPAVPPPPATPPQPVVPAAPTPMPGVTSTLDSVLRDVLLHSGSGNPSLATPTPVNQPQPTTGSTGKVSEFDLDRILSDYMHNEAQGERPEIELLGNPSFFAGDTVALQVLVTAGSQRRLLVNVPVVVKILGTAFKPQVHSTVTGVDGIAVLTVTLPHFAAGSAALVIQATSEGGETEIKQLIRRR